MWKTFSSSFDLNLIQILRNSLGTAKIQLFLLNICAGAA